MANKSFFEELTGYRVKVKRDGKEIVNVPGILALPGLLVAPKASIVGMIAAPILGCSIHVENEDSREVDIEKAVKDAADTFADTAGTVVRTVRDTIEKAWNEMSADDPEGCPEGEENEDAPDEEPPAEDDIPTVHVDPEDSEKE